MELQLTCNLFVLYYNKVSFSVKSNPGGHSINFSVNNMLNSYITGSADQKPFFLLNNSPGAGCLVTWDNCSNATIPFKLTLG